MKEITVTFENGGVFNGSANSFTLDNLITYYFAIDKNYRVQVNANTMAIELQEYQNTNGAWYGIDIITAISVQEVQGGGSGSGGVTKEYLEENYYSKAQVDQIAGRFYTKDETDERYVRKTGDTMSGSLTFDYDNYSLVISSDTITISGETTRLFQVYRNNLNIYQGGIYLRLGGAGSNSAVTLNTNGIYIYGNDNKIVGSFSQENSRGSAGIHLFNDGRLVLHSQGPGITEAYIQLKASSFAGYNGAILNFLIDSVFEYAFTTRGKATFNNYVTANYGIESKSNITVVSGNNKTVISPGSLTNSTDTNKVYISSDNFAIYKNDAIYINFSSYRGMDLYNGLSFIAHGDTSDKQTAYTYLGLNCYNLNSNDVWTANFGGARCEFSNLYTLLINTIGLISITAGTSLELRDNRGIINVGNTTQTLNNSFFGQTFLDALNMLLEQIQNNIKATSPLYQIVSRIDFDGQDYGGGFSAGGGSSRGGGVGRRT